MRVQRGLIAGPGRLLGLWWAAKGERLLASADPQAALACFERAIQSDRLSVKALLGRGLALRRLSRDEEAVRSYDAALGLAPGQPEALYRKGNSLLLLRRSADALACYDASLATRSDHADTHYNRGLALQDLGRFREAVDSYDRALALSPGDAEALNNRGNALMQLRRVQAALDSYEAALRAAPDMPDALFNRALALLEIKRPQEAVEPLRRLVTLVPDYPYAKGKLLHAFMLTCDWDHTAPLLADVAAGVRRGERAIEPFGFQGLSEDLELLGECARIYSSTNPPAAARLPPARPGVGTRIRIGYVSGEFREQATSILIAELIERHNRDRFEVFGFDSGWDDGSPMRRRLERAFDRLISIRESSDRDAAEQVSALGIDILVDLNGFFGQARQGIFAHRPSPVQVNYLGFPGTLGAPYMDYIVADRHVIPEEQAMHYTERVAWLPDSYQPNDRHRRIAEYTPARRQLGLPEHGFVFCCFNNNYKLTPEVFDVWMRLLRSIEGSVLWLLKDNAAVEVHLREEAERRSVDPSRIVFAPRLPLEEHLARHRAADLFLDTLPSNAHTTASDSLWAGLPVLTCAGGAFPGRVAMSLLHAAGLPELATDSLADYEALALALAGDPARLATLRRRLVVNRDACPLFDIERYRRHLESAYATMHERAARGLKPENFRVEPIG